MKDITQFLIGHTEFSEKIEKRQTEKLGMLLARELNEVESALLMEGSTEKQIKNMEEKWQEHFTSQGLVGKRLEKLVGESSEEERETPRQLQRRPRGAISNIRYYNSRSNELAEEELFRLRGNNLLRNNPSGIYSPQSLPPRKGQKLEKKA